MAPNHGFEPRLPESESGVLPLHQSGMWLQERDSNPHNTAYEAGVLPVDYPAVCGVEGRVRTFALRIIDPLLCRLSYSNMMVTPAGFEPGITGLKVLRPGLLDEGAVSALFPGLMFYAVIWI